jgi:hypothetical protein
MSDETESFEERVRRLEGQRVKPEEEVRKTTREAEDKMETAEEEATDGPLPGPGPAGPRGA